ncbi:XPA binding protein 1, putative [Plasmodium sp. gorilla clade G3]|nr:XPA binding protein 1, putative [Plasmodium sp. gorilla clade G3]
MWYGQLVIGPPGSGKSTYVAGVTHILKQINRKTVIINLDPFIENDIYEADINISDLIDIEKVFSDMGLGPNGTLIYCMEYLLINIDWLEEKLNRYKDSYLIIDTPGQVELYTHNDALKNIVLRLNKLNCRLTSVHIVDSTLCSDGYKYISSLLLSLCSQIHLELPHVNVFSKIDLLKYFKHDLKFPLSYYVEAQNLNQLILYETYKNYSSSEDENLSYNYNKNLNNKMTNTNVENYNKNVMRTDNINYNELKQDPFLYDIIKNEKKNYKKYSNKFLKLNEYICETVEDYNLINFALLDIQDKFSVLKLLKIIDGANGFRFTSIYSEYSLFDTYVENIEYDCDEIEEKIMATSDEDGKK